MCPQIFKYVQWSVSVNTISMFFLHRDLPNIHQYNDCASYHQPNNQWIKYGLPTSYTHDQKHKEASSNEFCRSWTNKLQKKIVILQGHGFLGLSTIYRTSKCSSVWTLGE